MKEKINIFLVIVIVLLLGILWVDHSTEPLGTTDNTLKPCDIYNTDQSEDWCQPYINFGYANGAIMAKRILGENEQLCSNASLAGTPSDNCLPTLNPRQVIDELYDQYKDKDYPNFAAGIKQKDGSYKFIHY